MWYKIRQFYLKRLKCHNIYVNYLLFRGQLRSWETFPTKLCKQIDSWKSSKQVSLINEQLYTNADFILLTFLLIFEFITIF